MLSIRFKRTGKKNQPSYRVIVTPKRAGGPKGKPVEYLGWFNPFSKEFALKKERIFYWLSQGAKASDSMHNLLVRAGVIRAGKISVHKKSKKKTQTQLAEAARSTESEQVQEAKSPASTESAAAVPAIESEPKPLAEESEAAPAE